MSAAAAEHSPAQNTKHAQEGHMQLRLVKGTKRHGARRSGSRVPERWGVGARKSNVGVHGILSSSF